MTRQADAGVSPVADAIREAIDRSPQRAISFRDYMNLCLYHVPFGYYNRPAAKVGKDGDFYTNVSVGTIMGEVLGGYMSRLAERYDPDRPIAVVEWGGGTGRLAGIVLDTIAARSPDLYERLDYVMIEISPYHRRLQREELRRHRMVRHAEADDWLNEAGEGAVIVFSNELLDAFPVHIVERRNGELLEWHVGRDERTDRFVPVRLPLEPGSPAAVYIEREAIVPREGQLVEANPGALEWIGRIGKRLSEGAVITIDYGDTADELYAAHRMRGTLLCYRNHTAHDDPFAYPGEQDMTSHVNFTALERAGREAGLTGGTLRTQRQFLLEEGVLDMLTAHDGRDPFGPEARRNRAVRQLLLGDSGAELFKVLVQTKKR
ncbi:class I SAM-dependent methyltransferase [Paenibacillus sp. GYB003]|uniref:class I SAM-dependent methyltransferase n=1 Tax=Paenibacillus sp. GYB003 TaxID=2994392 RepID=UPI002F96850E